MKERLAGILDRGVQNHPGRGNIQLLLRFLIRHDVLDKDEGAILGTYDPSTDKVRFSELGVWTSGFASHLANLPIGSAPPKAIEPVVRKLNCLLARRGVPALVWLAYDMESGGPYRIGIKTREAP